MTTSGTVTFSVTRDQIIIDALQTLGVMGSTDTTSSASFTSNSVMAATSLNMIMKQLSGRANTGPGTLPWEFKRAYLFLSNSANSYGLGPVASGGDRWVTGFTRTTLTAAAAASATALTVASITGISSGDQLGVVLDSGTLYWTTVNGAPSGSTVTANAGITTAASSGNYVYAYTASTKQARRPIELVTDSVVLRDSSSNDTMLNGFDTLGDYMELPTKTQSVDPAQFWYEAQLDVGQLYLDGYAADVTKQIYAAFQSPVEDLSIASTSSETIDMSQQCYRYLAHGLAYELWPKFPNASLYPAIKLLRDEAFMAMTAFYPEVSSASFQPHQPQ